METQAPGAGAVGSGNHPAPLTLMSYGLTITLISDPEMLLMYE